jgi:transposase
MITLHLETPEQPLLEETCKTTPDRRLRNRCQAGLMADHGRRHDAIAADLAVSPRTLQRWRNAYRARQLEGLRITWASGRAPHIPETLAPEIVTWVKESLAGCGLDRANWTYEALATSLYPRTGMAVSTSTMRHFCTKHEVRPYRPTYQYLKADAARQEIARNDLEALKKSRNGCTHPPESRCGALCNGADTPDDPRAYRALPRRRPPCLPK